MKVKCICKTFEELPKEIFNSLHQISILNNLNSNKPDITVGKEYIVYGIHSSLGNTWYFIADDDYIDYPVYVLSVFFKIIDPRVSKYWQFNINENGNFSLWPPSWNQIEYYFDRLTDGEPDIVEDFQKIKEQIDLEAE
jgi:hypothetical protein